MPVAEGRDVADSGLWAQFLADDGASLAAEPAEAPTWTESAVDSARFGRGSTPPPAEDQIASEERQLIEAYLDFVASHR